jgi:protein disulfide-isomerase
MRRHRPPYFFLILCALLAAPATTLRSVHAQPESFSEGAASVGIRWQHDLEAAKTLASQTQRLVLIHFWTPDCAPCMTLEQTVFNQQAVAGAIEAQFVPVKLNANENPATAQGFGITRVPTDVIITPKGEVVGKLISPPTPSAFVAEVNQIASKHTTTLGSPFARATASTPSPPQLNAAYANLTLPASTLPAAAQPVIAEHAPVAASPASARPVVAPLSAENQYAPHSSDVAAHPVAPPISQSPGPASAQPAARQVTNQFAPPSVAPPLAAALPTVRQVTNQFAAPPAVGAQAALQPSANTAALVGAAPDASKLPAGSPPLGFDGYCPVSMRNQWKWVPGDPRWGIVHRGRTYWFAGPSEQQQFWTDPDRYSPALSGMDPVMAMDHQQQVPGKREHAIDYDGLFYMFCSEATLQQFTANPERYAVGVRQAMGIPRGRLVR